MIKTLINNKQYKTDKFTCHSYLETYEEIFKSIKYSAKNILEIGVSHGGSILLWRDYFVNAQIYGIDIQDMPEDIVNDSRERITIIKDNAYSEQFIQNNFIKKGIKFDVLIDDGPHTLESFLFFIKYYPSLMTPNALLIIEDIPDLESPVKIINALPQELRAKARIVNLRHIQNRWDDILVIVDTV